MSDFASMGEGQATEAPAATQGNTPEIQSIVDSGDGPDYSWAGDVSDDDKGWLENKGFSNAEEAIKSHRSLEGFHGVSADRLMKLPDDGGDMGDIYNKLGRPETIEGYKFEAEGFEETQLTGLLKEVGHKHGLTASAYTEIVGKALEMETASQQAIQEAKTAEYNNEISSMQSDWGTKYEEVLGSADRAVRALGISDEQRDAIVDSMGPRQAVEMLNKMYSSLGEDVVASVNNEEPYGKTQEATEQELSQLMRDIGNDRKRKDTFDTKSGEDYAKYIRLSNTQEQYYRD